MLDQTRAYVNPSKDHTRAHVDPCKDHTRALCEPIRNETTATINPVIKIGNSAQAVIADKFRFKKNKRVRKNRFRAWRAVFRAEKAALLVIIRFANARVEKHNDLFFEWSFGEDRPCGPCHHVGVLLTIESSVW